jgi:hypothetical protein
MADIHDVSVNDRLFIKTQPKKRPRVVTVQSVDHEAGTFTTTTGETITDIALVEGWDLAGDLFNIPKDQA